MKLHSDWRGAFSLVETVVVLTAVGVLAAGGAVAVRQPDGRAKAAQCRMQLNQMHKGVVFWAEDHNGRLPRPTEVCADTAAAGAQRGNSSANFYSIMIWNTYYSPAVVVCPGEASERVKVIENYRYGAGHERDWREEWWWDPAFSCDIEAGTSNASYAHVALIGERINRDWARTTDPVPIFADRGHRDGAFDPDSITNRLHGSEQHWSGHVAFTDGRVTTRTQRAHDPKPFDWQGDNIFFREDDRERRADVWLGLFGATDEEATRPMWD